jgi:MFS family permease
VLFSFIFLVISLELLVIFTLFLGINFAIVSIIDVTVDKFMVEQNRDEEIKQKNVLFVQLGSIIGAIIPNIFYFVLMSDKTSSAQWNLFFIAGIVAIVPLIPIVFMMKDEESKEIVTTPRSGNETPISVKVIALMGVFLFLAYSNNLYNWLLEPWALERVSNGIFSIFMILFILLNAIGIIIAGKISHKYDRKMLLIMSCVVSGVLMAIAPFMNMYVFFVLVSITQLLSGFFLINLTTIMIDVSRRRVVVFQILASCIVLAKVTLIPLGTALSAVLSTEIIIMIAGILLAISAIPVYFVEHDISF